jgi:hypothetical protein
MGRSYDEKRAYYQSILKGMTPQQRADYINHMPLNDIQYTISDEQIARGKQINKIIKKTALAVFLGNVALHTYNANVSHKQRYGYGYGDLARAMFSGNPSTRDIQIRTHAGLHYLTPNPPRFKPN